MVGPEISRRLPVYDNLKLTYTEVLGMVIFGAFSVCYNVAKRWPLQRQIPRHILIGLIGLPVGRFFNGIYEERRNRSALIIEDYISKHPEDFPLATTKKYKDVFQSWVPVR